MLGRIKEQVSTKRFGWKSVSSVAVSSALTGLLMASGLNWVKPSVAEVPAVVQQASIPGPAAVEGSFSSLAEKLSPTVVNVKVTKVQKTFGPPMMRMPGRQQDDWPDNRMDEFFRRFFNDRDQFPNSQPVQGAGSGVIISDDGYILTNNHVIEGAKEVTVTLADQQELKAEIVGRDPKTDLAILKVSPEKDLPSAKMGDSDALRVGDWVLAVGNPFGLSHTVTSGIVSAKGRVIGAGPYDDFIQTDASINPGNSGGPLFNMQGEVVGINTAIIPNGQGIGFAIPVNTAKPLIPQLVEDGEVTRGYIGVNIQSITPELATAMKIGDRRGALVADVVPGGPADQAGVDPGDVIVSFNGKAIKDSHELPAVVAVFPVDKEANMTVLRDGKEIQIRITVARLASDESASTDSKRYAQGKWGLQLQTLTPDVARRYGIDAEQGVLVVGIQPGSPADKASVREGDIILEVNRQAVKSAGEIKEKLDSKESNLLLVQRNKTKLYIALQG